MNSPITDLSQLLASLDPFLDPAEYVFVSLSDRSAGADRYLPNLGRLVPRCVYHEAEGASLILERQAAASAGFPTDQAFRCITLRVKSSLMAVGLTAVVASALAKRGISANVVAAFHHDHVYVPQDRAEEALATLWKLSTEALAVQY